MHLCPLGYPHLLPILGVAGVAWLANSDPEGAQSFQQDGVSFHQPSDDDVEQGVNHCVGLLSGE